MENILLVIHLLIALALVGTVLMQRSEGGALGIGGGGGGGAGGPGMFSARGAANALTRTTAILAAAFMATSLALAILAGTETEHDSIFNSATPEASQEAPAAPAADEGPSVPLSE
ncbi:preprotein translocase subunit SecG [Marivibrio halodurans]|uniref:Protein-export membrane protein SecG n=1 Tax=Marivibrio halodurans TaxID=2039722 RepID=A0A8J7UZA7_9PROT|nr:preprotein translocase subunit SecG [Marivibrio halodurans]MBP5855481.1 preprotein translocase subunit SecG [Marivibrio halodurans]